MNISVRDVDPKVFRDFKAEVAREGVSMGAALSNALRHWFECVKKSEKKRASLLDVKPVDFGPGSEKWSREIDETLYGGKIGRQIGGKAR